MKKIIAVLLTVMLGASMMIPAMAVGEATQATGEANIPASKSAPVQKDLDSNNVDGAGLYYTLNDETKTAVVGKDEYDSSASGAAKVSDSSIVIPETVKKGSNVYKVTAIGKNAFDGIKSVTAVTIGDNVEKIGEFAFAGCTSLKSVKMGAAVKSVAGFAFWGCDALVSAGMNDGLESVGGGAFWSCDTLQYVTVPASVAKVMKSAFMDCDSLGYVAFLGTAPAVGADVLAGCGKLAGIKYNVNTGFDGAFAASLGIDAAKMTKAEAAVYVGGGSGVCNDKAKNAVIDICLENVSSGMTNVTLDIVIPEGLVFKSCKLDGYEASVTATPNGSRYTIAVSAAEAIKNSARIAIECDINDKFTSTAADTYKTVTATINSVKSGETVIPAAVKANADVVVLVCNHTDAKWQIAVNPTATSNGVEHLVCPKCETVLETREYVCPHENSTWVKVREATASGEGLEQRICNLCGKVLEEKTIARLAKPGDVDGNGSIETDDVILLVRHMAGWKVEISQTGADADGNGKIETDDVILLVRYMAGWKVELGKVN